MKALKVNNKLVKAFYYNGKKINDKYDFEIELTELESQALKWEDTDPTINYKLETINQKYNAEIVGVEEQLKLF